MWARWGADQVLGRARGYIRIEGQGGDEVIYAHVTVLENLHESIWKASAANLLLDVSLVKAVLAYVDVPEGIRPLVPRYAV